MAAPARASPRTTSPTGSSAAASVRVKLKPNKHFRLPAPDTRHHHGRPRHRRRAVPRLRAGAPRHAGRPAGTGCSSATAQFTHDFLYQLEWQEALKDGALTRLDVAFSRDPPEKVYVQHRIWERRARSGRVARGRRALLCLRRCQGDGEGRARHAGRAYADVKQLCRPRPPSRRWPTLEHDKRYQHGTY